MLRIHIILASLFAYASASLLAIDYGGEWIKASLIKPGVPFDVLLNRDSKRKIQSSVAWKGEDRMFGGDAFALASRFPVDSFNGLKLVQGRPIKDDPIVDFFFQISLNDVIETSRATVGFQRPPSKKKSGVQTEKDSDRRWSTEELIAMQLSYVKDLADSVSSVSSEKVKDVVVTVPPFYTQQERQALADAVEIAGLKLLAFISDGAAVAVNYAMTRTFEEKEIHVFYDAGATSITATVVAFSNPPGSKDRKVGSDIAILASAFNRNATGMELDRRMRDILVQEFTAKNPSKDIRTEKRALARLWKEAGRVKTILSANSEAVANVESVAFDIDFKSKITRTQFENACSDLKWKFSEPVLEAVKKAGLTLDDIKSVVLVGGASRTPMIQAAVTDAVGQGKIAANVNADEAAVLGAALYGASLSRQIKTKQIKLSDVFQWDISIGYPAASGTKQLNTIVFPAGSKLDAKKTLTLKNKEDFLMKFGYKDTRLGALTNIFSVEFEGIKEALGNMTERLNGSSEPAVKITVELDSNGFVKIVDAVVWGDVKESLTGMLKNLFGGSGSNSTESESETASTTSTTSSSTAEESSSSSSGTSSSTASSKSPSATPSAKERSTIKLKYDTNFQGVRPLTKEEKRESRSRLSSLDYAELQKQRKSETRNSLEAYLYRLRDLLASEASAPFIECSSEAERDKIEKKLDETMSWLQESADDASLAVLLEKRASLESLEKPIQTRYLERQGYPQALSDLQQAHWVTRIFLESAAQNATLEVKEGRPSKWTEEEIQDIERKLKDSEVWLNEGVEKQKKLKRCGDGDPPILINELKARGQTLQRQVQKLTRRKVPPIRASTSTGTESTSATSATETPTASTTESDTRATTTPVGEEKEHLRGEL